MAFVKLLLLLQLLLSTKNLTSSRGLKARNSLHFCLLKKIFALESIAAHDLRKKFNFWNLWVDLTQRMPTQIMMAYGITPYVGMAPKKNGGHIKSAQMTCSKCRR